MCCAGVIIFSISNETFDSPEHTTFLLKQHPTVSGMTHAFCMQWENTPFKSGHPILETAYLGFSTHTRNTKALLAEDNIRTGKYTPC